MLVYSKISTLLSKRALFYTTAMPFFAFYLFFKLVMYPMRDALHPSATSAAAASLPEGMSYLVNIYRHWTFALFYVVAELYSSVRRGQASQARHLVSTHCRIAHIGVSNRAFSFFPFSLLFSLFPPFFFFPFLVASLFPLFLFPYFFPSSLSRGVPFSLLFPLLFLLFPPFHLFCFVCLLYVGSIAFMDARGTSFARKL